MQVIEVKPRSLAPLALALIGALLAALAFTVGADKRAAAITNCTVSHDANDSEEMAFLSLINGYRQQNGLGTLTISTNLNRGAAWMAEDLATNNYFAHTDSLGRSPYSRAIDCGYPSGAGENLAAGGAWSSASAAFQAWKNSPGHNANMLGEYYKQIGIARYYGAGSQYGWYWATTFGAANDGTGGGGAGPTNTPVPPTNTPTNTPVPATNTPQGQGGQNPTATPTQPLPTSTPTPSNQGGGGPGPQPTQPLPTSTPTPKPVQASGDETPPSPPTPPLPTSTPTSKANTPPAATATPANTNTPTPAPTKTPSPTPTSNPGNSLPLSPGANLVAWPSGNVAPDEAFKGNTTVSVVYEWDPATGEWKRYFPGLPDYLNNLKTLKKGGAYWVIAKSKSSLTIGR